MVDCREYNKFVASVAEESNKMKAVQKEAVAKQVQLDEESLQRLKEAEATNKVHNKKEVNKGDTHRDSEKRRDREILRFYHTEFGYATRGRLAQ